MQLYLVYQYIKMCVLIRQTFCESLVKICVNKRKFRSFLRHYLQKYSVSVVNVPKKCRLGLCYWTTISQNLKKISTDEHFLFLSCLYTVHFGLGPFFPKVAKSWSIDLLKSKPKYNKDFQNELPSKYF